MLDASMAERFEHAFARGDVCAAAIFTLPDSGQKLLASYNFFAYHSTVINDHIEFSFPAEQYCYSYATFTHPDHRGNKIAPSLWTYASQVMQQEVPSIFYISMTNLPSIKAGYEHRTKLGFAGFRLNQKAGAKEEVRIFNSPGCRRHRVGFQLRQISPQGEANY